MPKRGFNNISRKNIVALNVRDLERFENGTVGTIESLLESGLIKAVKDGVKILATGELTKSLTIRMDKVSPAAAKKISHTDDNPIMFRGRKLNVKTIRMLRSAERGLGERLVITQGSVNSSVQASAGTHDGGGVFDVSVRAGGARRQRKVRVLSRAGFAAWHRLHPVNGPRRQVSRRAFDTWRPARDR